MSKIYKIKYLANMLFFMYLNIATDPVFAAEGKDKSIKRLILGRQLDEQMTRFQPLAGVETQTLNEQVNSKDINRWYFLDRHTQDEDHETQIEIDAKTTYIGLKADFNSCSLDSKYDGFFNEIYFDYSVFKFAKPSEIKRFIETYLTPTGQVFLRGFDFGNRSPLSFIIESIQNPESNSILEEIIFPPYKYIQSISQINGSNSTEIKTIEDNIIALYREISKHAKFIELEQVYNRRKALEFILKFEEYLSGELIYREYPIFNLLCQQQHPAGHLEHIFIGSLKPKAPLADGVVEALDPETGKVFYFNRKTGCFVYNQ